MRSNFYGRKIFVADLIVTSVWALFAIRYSLLGDWPIVLYVVMRISLCFEMKLSSPWVRYSAILFFIFCSNYVWSASAIYPFKRLIYYTGAWMGYSSETVKWLNEAVNSQMKALLYVCSSVIYLWLLGIPVVAAVVQKQNKCINWKRKWIWGYIVGACLIELCIVAYDKHASAFVFGLLLWLLPLVYRHIYNRAGQSFIDLISHNVSVVRYALFVLFLSICILIGKENVVLFKWIALSVMPVLFYVLICRCCGYRPLTRHAFALSLSGTCYGSIFHMPAGVKIAALSISILLVLYVAVDIYMRHRDGRIAMAVFFLQTLVSVPLILGLNPYACLSSGAMFRHCNGYSAGSEIFFIEKDGRYGIRDRFGVILEPRYELFSCLDKYGRYITTNVCNGSMIWDNRYGVYDMFERRFVLDPQEVAVAQVIQTGENRFNLMAPDGSHVGTLRLPGYHYDKDEYMKRIVIETPGDVAEGL